MDPSASKRKTAEFIFMFDLLGGVWFAFMIVLKFNQCLKYRQTGISAEAAHATSCGHYVNDYDQQTWQPVIQHPVSLSRKVGGTCAVTATCGTLWHCVAHLSENHRQPLHIAFGAGRDARVTSVPSTAQVSEHQVFPVSMDHWICSWNESLLLLVACTWQWNGGPYLSILNTLLVSMIKVSRRGTGNGLALCQDVLYSKTDTDHSI